MKFDPMPRPTPLPRPSPLPEQEAAAHFAWREGWYQGMAVGAILGVCVAVIFLRA